MEFSVRQLSVDCRTESIVGTLQSMLTTFSPFNIYSERGLVVNSIVENVGSYFPFVNREDCLRLLWERISVSIKWANKKRGTTNSYEYEGAQYLAICGSSGVGKTTFATDGIAKLSKEIKSLVSDADESHVALLKESVERYVQLQFGAHRRYSGTIFRLSFVDVKVEEKEKALPRLCLACRVLYQYLSVFKAVDLSYIKFFELMQTRLPELRLGDVTEFIRQRKEVKEQLIIVQIDETQVVDFHTHFKVFRNCSECKKSRLDSKGRSHFCTSC